MAKRKPSVRTSDQNILTNASDRPERHNIQRIGWLCAVVLGAKDDIGVTFGGALAMAITAGAGVMFDAAI